MSNAQPYEVIGQPFTVYVAAVGTTFPKLDDNDAAIVAAGWTKVGSSGDLNYNEDGVTIQHAQSVEPWRPAGSVGPRKAFRTEEEMRVSMTVVDLTLEQYALALNHNTVTDVPADAVDVGYRKLGLSRGMELPRRALLVRGGVSPYGADFAMQYEVPVAVQAGEPEVVYTKGEPAGLALEWLVLEDPNAASADERFGRLLAQDADVTS